MKTFLIYSACVVLFCIANCLGEPKEPKRNKLASVYALTPSLRVGRRSSPDLDFPKGPFADVKRRIGKMVSFPRIGRSESNWVPDDNSYGAQRPGANSGGMWFGPRLGRVQKRSDDFTPWAYIILNGEGPIIRQVHYSPRLGRESEEAYEEVLDSNLDVL
ncbi:CAPA peptides-like [Tribolium madens]|uniref:CAPA peptides-like n=1 Tax=Tribolium madens TaxID=41895 RepID=UPI001CF74572|nr:CAPA peptides-like [Tribolium madens]